MSCETIQLPDGGVGVVCSRSRHPGSRTRCTFCGTMGAPILCDGAPPSGADRKTCDAPLCRSCATHVGPDRDLCPRCQDLAVEAERAKAQATPGAEPARCRSCSAPIWWAATSNGKAMPIDADPVPDGNVLLFKKPDGTLRAEVLGPKAVRPTGVRLRVSHFVTCPAAAKHRRKP